MADEENTAPRMERRDAAENRQRILNAAIRLFEKHGVEQVSMNQIAIEAQIGPGTLYRRYRNKSDLCRDLITDHVDFLFDDMDAYMKENAAIPAGRRLKEVLALFIRFREKKAQLLAGVEDSAPPSRGRPRIKSPLYQDLQQLIVALFEEMNIPGQTHASHVFRADMMLTALTSESYFFQRDVRGYTPEEIAELLYATFVPLAD